MRAGSDILEDSPAGQRNAARRALQAQGVQVVSRAMVTRVELTPTPLQQQQQQQQQQQAEQLTNGTSISHPTAGMDAQPTRRAVHLKLPGEADKVGAS